MQMGDWRNPGGLQGLTCAPNNHVYGYSYKGVAYFNGASWSITPKEQIGMTYAKGLTVDTTGTPWLISSDTLFRRVGPTWQAVDLSMFFRRRASLRAITSAKDGSVYVAHSKGVLRYYQSQWMPISVRRRSMYPQALATTAHNQLVVLTSKRIALVDPNSGSVRWRGPFQHSSLRELAIDGTGRIWLISSSGLTVIKTTGEEVVFHSGQLAALAGDIKTLLVLNNGPTLPTPGPTLRANVKGLILRDGQPVAYATVELCASPALIYYRRGTPCSKDPLRRVATTDAQGNFVFQDVPISSFSFAVRDGRRWKVMFRKFGGALMKPGLDYHVGAIQLR